MVQIKVGKWTLRQERGVRQAGKFIDRRVFGDATGFFDRIAQRFQAQVGRAGMTFLLAKIDGYGQTLVAVVFDGFDFAHAHVDAVANALGNFGLGGAGPEFSRKFE